MRTRNKLLTSALVVAVLGSVSALGVFGLFSATTQNAGNEISSGTVTLSDNDAGSAEFHIANAKPGESWTRCIKVTYNGSIPADIHGYGTGGGGTLAPYLQLVASQGTAPGATFPSCAGFVPDGSGGGTGVTYEGPALGLGATSYDTGGPVLPFGQTVWNQGDSLVLKTVMTLNANAPELAQGSSTGDFTIVFEARNH